MTESNIKTWIFPFQLLRNSRGGLDLVSKMADPSDLFREGKPTDVQNDREYLSEWPPRDDREESEKIIQRKRQKLERTNLVDVDERQTGAQESELESHRERVLWARPALARWWRKRQKQSNLKDYSNKPKSDNPKTLLRYVAR